MVDNLRDESALCQACGLCCQGQLYGRVPLLAEEIALARTWPVEFTTYKDVVNLKQPCGCFQEQRCSVYSQRPQTCVKYRCQLLRRLGQNEISQAEAVKLVTQALELLGKIQAHLTVAANKHIWKRITERWDLSNLQPLLTSGELDSDTLMAIIALDVLLTKYFRNVKDKPWFKISEV
jgi:Fe-S-cluster containining protein